jgi:hypothetical protein
MKMTNARTIWVMTVVLILGGTLQAAVITFSDLDPGLPFNQQGEMPANYSTGMPAGVVATWTGFYWKNAAGPDDHTPDNDDQMQVFGSESTASIAFSVPLIVDEIWMHKTSWGDTGDWPVKGLLGGVEQWSSTVTTSDMWTSVQTGAGILIDELSFPQQSLWNHIDDISVIPEPATILLLGLGTALLRKRTKP